MGIVKKLHHIGYLVKNLEKSIKDFEFIGYQKGVGDYDDIQKSDILFMYLQDICIELVCPHKDSEIYPLLKRYKNSPYHICYLVDNLELAIDEFLKKGYVLFKPPVKANVIGSNSNVVFLMSNNSGLVELVEFKKVL